MERTPASDGQPPASGCPEFHGEIRARAQARRVVVVGIEPADQPALGGALESDDCYQVTWVSTAESLARLPQQRLPHLILVALREVLRVNATGETGLASLEALRRVLPGSAWTVPVIAVLPDGASEADIERLQDLPDFLTPPFRAAEVRGRVRRLLERERARNPAETVARVVETLGLETLWGESVAFSGIKARLPVVARADTTVLVSGETGTGKEMVARTLHYLSPRAHAPFLPVDCGAIPVDLFENELFGHRRGAFTDARSAETGLVAEAEGGTLFLDEVDAIPLPAQTTLLRFLQSQTYRPLGGAAVQRANVRVIAATNADLEARIAEGTFRKDLYYRLDIIPLALPPLRERPGDVPLLARHFLDKWAPTGDRDRWEFAPECLDLLAAYAWPGNVRELENLVHQIVATTPPGVIGCGLLPSRIARSRVSRAAPSFREAKAAAIAAFEREYVSRLFTAANGNVTRAAQAAGQDRRVFGRLIKKHRIKMAS